MKSPSLFSQIRLSISTRLTLWYGLTLLILLSLFAVFSYSNFHFGLNRDFDRHLTHEEHELLSFIRFNGDQPSFQSLEDLRSVAFQTDGIYGTYVRLISTAGKVLYRSPNFERRDPLPVEAPTEIGTKTVGRVWTGQQSRSRYAPLISDDGTLAGWLEVTGIEWSLHQELSRLANALIIGIIISVLLALVGGYLLARRALRPVAALTEAANKIRATDLAARLPAKFGVRDELTDLAETFNSMIERLEASFNRERRFSANAAHELMTPLTNMRNSVDVTLRRERTNDRYQSTLRTILLDIEQMSETVRGLLRISQAELLAELPTEPINLNQLARECAERFHERAGAKEIDIQLALEPGTFVDGDAARLTEVLENLVDNSIKYTQRGGEITIEVEGDSEKVRTRVSDNGMGFSDELANQLFDRFYRADTSDVQALEGSGLGLTIVQTIVHAYGGSVSARSDGPGKGSTFEVVFPRTSSSS